ncbi:VOC family protein [Nonomuraea aurantiaca]|uniref:VOC family protein n=1 Tax=Nonomuraea aurantiaca TaxID=2878562 RepID=UPI001CD94565|nr:hypothetical protein [Nonomuraea aurantiaca]MCA2230226.1 hypothetical protein [Nonomuraea aurantiaca]
MILNFHAVEAQLQAAGVEWLIPVADHPGGRIGMFVDPDGNHLQIIQLNPDA